MEASVEDAIAGERSPKPLLVKPWCPSKPLDLLEAARDRALARPRRPRRRRIDGESRLLEPGMMFTMVAR